MRQGLLTALVFLAACTNTGELYDPLRYGLGVDVGASGQSIWRFEDGVLSPEAATAASYIVTRHSYTNFELTLDVHPVGPTNSGVLVRCKGPGEVSPYDCYEINIWDQHENPELRTGSIVRISPPKVTVQSEDRWNTLRVRAEGERLQVWFNGKQTNDIRNDRHQSGPIAFQYGGNDGMVHFRNIRIRELP